jgi:hypothetical protein
VVGPLLLIFLGAIFLLQNTGYLPSNFWVNLWRLWPLILVLVGLDLLLANRIPSLALAGVAAVVLVCGAVLINASVPQAPTLALTTSSSRTDLGGAMQAIVTVRFGAGELVIAPLTDPVAPDLLATMSYEGPAELKPQTRYTAESGGTGQLEYQISGRGPGFPFAGNRMDAMRMQVNLTPSVPITRLTVQAGATDARLDLSTLQISDLDLSIGAASTSVRLPQAMAGTTNVHISGGAATLTLEVPPGAAAQISHKGGLSNFTIDSTRFPEVRDGLHRSPDYDSNPRKVDINLETGFVTIQVN